MSELINVEEEIKEVPVTEKMTVASEDADGVVELKEVLAETGKQIIKVVGEGLQEKLDTIKGIGEEIIASASEESHTEEFLKFKTESQELIEKLQNVPNLLGLSDEEKKAEGDNIRGQIQKLTEDYFNLGLAKLVETKNKELDRLEKNIEVFEKLKEIAELGLTDRNLIVDKLKESPLFYDSSVEGDIPEGSYLSYKAAETVLTHSENKEKVIKSIDEVIDRNKETFANLKVTYDPRDLLDTITPYTLKQKITVLSNNSLLFFKKKTLANFMRKKIKNPMFHKNYKHDSDYLGFIMALLSADLPLAITKYDVIVEDGEDRDAVYTAFLKGPVANTLILLTALFIADFVIDIFNDNTKTDIQRDRHLGLLYTNTSYAVYRQMVLKHVYITGEITI